MKYPIVGSRYCHSPESNNPAWFTLLGYHDMQWTVANELHRNNKLLGMLRSQPSVKGDRAFCIDSEGLLYHTSLGSLEHSKIEPITDTIYNRLLKE
jgi:hypothetical protein